MGERKEVLELVWHLEGRGVGMVARQSWPVVWWEARAKLSEPFPGESARKCELDSPLHELPEERHGEVPRNAQFHGVGDSQLLGVVVLCRDEVGCAGVPADVLPRLCMTRLSPGFRPTCSARASLGLSSWCPLVPLPTSCGARGR